jgi:predicted RND superfamily exporter protein
MDRLVDRLEDIQGREAIVEGFERSLLDTLPDALDQLYGALDAQPVSLETLPADVSRRMVAPDGRARIQVLPAEDLSDNEALARFVDGVREVAPDATGSAVTLLEWARATARSFREALLAAVIAVAAVVWLLWRRVTDVALVLSPLLLAALLTAAASVVLGIAFNFVNVIVVPLLLGIGVDSGIHLVHRARIASREPLGDREADALLSSSTAQAVFFSAVTTMVSFGSLALSAHRGIASMGQLLLIGIAFTLACNLIVLPALLARRA